MQWINNCAEDKKTYKDCRGRRRMRENLDIEGIIRHVAEVIIGELKLEDVTADTFNPDMDLVEELGIDSMDLATIALVLQDEYRIVIGEDDYPRLKTIRRITDYIKEKLAVRS
jgi:acyl carrier protein